MRVIGVSRRHAVEVGERLQISGGVVRARLFESLIGQRLLGQLVEHVEEVAGCVDALIRQADQVAERVVAVGVGVVRLVWMVELDDGR